MKVAQAKEELAGSSSSLQTCVAEKRSLNTQLEVCRAEGRREAGLAARREKDWEAKMRAAEWRRGEAEAVAGELLGTGKVGKGGVKLRALKRGKMWHPRIRRSWNGLPGGMRS